MGQGSTPAAAPAGYRVPPPPRDAWIDWPEEFGTRFTVFVDTEEEFDWSAPLRRDGHGTSAMAALPATHARFVGRGVPLTYLVDWPIVTCAKSVDILRGLLADGHSAIGTQLHPWVNPPFDEDLTPANSFAGNLGTIEGAKLAQLTQAIALAFGTRPVSYRAGRYGIGPTTLELLAGLGYRLDTSMRAAYDYSGEGGPDFTAIGNEAFRTGPDGAIIELPFTTLFTGALRGAGTGLYRGLGQIPHGRGAAARLGVLSRVALTPEDMPLAEALEAVRIAVGEGIRVLNFSFHSPSVAPGHTPYVRDAADLAAFHLWWEEMLALLDRLNVRPASLDRLLAACEPG